MILDAIYYIIASVLRLITAPLRSLPDVWLPDWLYYGMANASSYVNALSYVLPVSTIKTIFVLYIGLEATYLTYKVIRWCYRKIPGVT